MAFKSISFKYRLNMDKIKEIFIRNLTTDEVRPLKISMSKTVKELKKEIEKLFNLDYSLDDYCIRVATNGMRFGKMIQEENEVKTLFENHFSIHCVVTFGRVKIIGGGYSKEINKISPIVKLALSHVHSYILRY